MSRDEIERPSHPSEEVSVHTHTEAVSFVFVCVPFLLSDILSFSIQCVVCCQARSVMQVSPCGHQCQCRLCFVQNIQEAVANRDLPLRCLICNAKILRVKNNSRNSSGLDHPVHVHGTTPGKMPKSVSGYSLGASAQGGGVQHMPHSHSSYSMSSGVSSMSGASSFSSTGSVRSGASVRSNQSSSSWFSVGSLSNFQGGKILDSNTFSKQPRVRKNIQYTAANFTLLPLA